MKHFALAVTALALVTGVGPASAADHALSKKSSKMPGAQSMATDNLSLTASQQKQAWNGIERQATKQNAPASFAASVGATVPQEITLTAVPANVATELPKLRQYDYALVSNKLLIVNPKDKKIVEVISGNA